MWAKVRVADTDQPLGDAAPDDALEQPTEQVAVAETAVAVLGESRVVRDRAYQVEPAEPDQEKPLDFIQKRPTKKKCRTTRVLKF